VAAILELTEGHVPTTLALLADERCATPEGPRAVFGELTKASEPLASRCTSWNPESDHTRSRRDCERAAIHSADDRCSSFSGVG
jgi:hypothetical protein